jgi:hypothetical protein
MARGTHRREDLNGHRRLENSSSSCPSDLAEGNLLSRTSDGSRKRDGRTENPHRDPRRISWVACSLGRVFFGSRVLRVGGFFGSREHGRAHFDLHRNRWSRFVRTGVVRQIVESSRRLSSQRLPRPRLPR